MKPIHAIEERMLARAGECGGWGDGDEVVNHGPEI